MSSFAVSHARDLVQVGNGSDLLNYEDSASGLSDQAEKLQGLITSDGTTSPNALLDPKTLRSKIEALKKLQPSRKLVDERGVTIESTSEAGGNERELKLLLEEQLFISLYAESLDAALKEAIEAENEMEWWAEMERSWANIAWYLIQTLPERLIRVIRTILAALRSRNIPITLSSFTPRSLRQLFPHTASLRPSVLQAAFFPHLRTIPNFAGSFATPLGLTRQECRLQKHKCQRLRDERAEALGRLSFLRTKLTKLQPLRNHLQEASDSLIDVLLEADSGSHNPQNPFIYSLDSIAFAHLPNSYSRFSSRLASVRRPSQWTRLWPRIVLIPPISFITLKAIYGSRETIIDTLYNIHETLVGFWIGYVIEPIRSILDTVRTGGDDRVAIVTPEALKADLDSLERMALALSQDTLSYSPEQLAKLAQQIRQGDLTPVLKVYEEDLKSPIKSAIGGSLIRSILIQVQKAKVDLDQALTGIDKLLKSQELTFAFVGVAPSLAIVYLAAGYLRGVWAGGRGNSQYGGRRRRETTLAAMRRIERLLNNESDSSLTSLTSGLILISVTQLRRFAETCLPSNSRIREGFLVDVVDLENPDLSREAKLRVVDRMWRSWGNVLGWRSLARLTN